MLKKFGMAAFTALTVLGSTVAMTSAADAQHRGWRGGHYGYHGGHYGYRGQGGGIGFIAPAIIGGLALGAAASHYGQGYGYGPRCWVQRQAVIDQWGRQFVRPVRVCR